VQQARLARSAGKGVGVDDSKTDQLWQGHETEIASIFQGSGEYRGSTAAPPHCLDTGSGEPPIVRLQKGNFHTK